MSILRRFQHGFRDEPGADAEKLQLPPNLDNEFAGFLEGNGLHLQEYAVGYSQVGDAMVRMAGDDDLKDIVVGVVGGSKQWVRHHGNRQQHLDPEEVADLYLTGAPTVITFSIKHHLEEHGRFGIMDAKKVAATFVTGSEHVDEITSNLIGSARVHTYATEIALGIKEAESRRAKVGGEFADTIGSNPNIVPAAVDFYNGVVGADDQVIDLAYTYWARDFRDVLAADLLSNGSGRVRQAVTGLADNPNVLLPVYADGVVAGAIEDVSLLNLATIAAQYAKDHGVAAASERDVIVSASEQWTTDPELGRGFSSYAVRTPKQHLAALSKVAGLDATGRRKGIRMPVNTEDLQLTVGAFGRLITGTHKRERNAPTRARAAGNFNFSADVLVEAERGGVEPKPLLVAKKGPNGHVADQEADSLEKKIKAYAGNNADLEHDVRRMLREISINPLTGPNGLPMYMKTDGVRTERFSDGSRHKVVEFSPQDRSFSLKSGKEGKRTRITYSVTPDGIMVYHIVHHDELDRIYSKK